jgi:lipopolysaccharide transport system ATP-binding protein
MSSEEPGELTVRVRHLSKRYRLYDRPYQRLQQAILPGLHRLIGRSPRSYCRELWALEDVSFEIHRGETLGIIGSNGSGKTTLLQLICGTVCPTRGEIEVSGRLAALLELGTGFSSDFTGRENVHLAAYLHGLSQQEIEARFDAIIAFAELQDFVDQPVRTYSTGMYLRLAFSVVAHLDPDILVIDEALAVGDAAFSQKCMRFLREFRRRGTLLFVSHDHSAVQSLCTSVLWLEHGKIRRHGPPKEVCEEYLATTMEALQGKGVRPPSAPRRRPAKPIRDPRQPLFDTSNLRNEIRVLDFNSEGEGFGVAGATVDSVELLDEAGNQVALLRGGEVVLLRIRCSVQTPLQSPIIGFLFKDRTGQALFGDNTYLSYLEDPPTMAEGEELVAEFRFQMPTLPNGKYSLAVAIAEGTQREAIQHHWIHDALTLESLSGSVATGLMGIPMMDIEMRRTVPGGSDLE